MITLSVEQRLHQKMIEASGGANGVHSLGALESAIAHVFASFDGKDLYPSIEEKAARQAYAIIRNHPFLEATNALVFSLC
jgi:death-on-curing protein